MSIKEKLFGKQVANKSNFFNKRITEIQNTYSDLLGDIELEKAITPSFDNNHLKYIVNSELPQIILDDVESAFQESLLK